MVFRRELGDERRGDGVVGAHEHADEEAVYHQLHGRGVGHAQSREQGDGDDVQDEHLLAPDDVGQITAHDAANQDAQQHRRADCRRPVRGQAHLRCDLGQCHADQRQHVAVKEGASARHQRDLAQKRRHGGFVKGLLPALRRAARRHFIRRHHVSLSLA